MLLLVDCRWVLGLPCGGVGLVGCYFVADWWCALGFSVLADLLVVIVVVALFVVGGFVSFGLCALWVAVWGVFLTI